MNKDLIDRLAPFVHGLGKAVLDEARATIEAQSVPAGPLSFNCANGCGFCGVKLVDFVTHATQAQCGEWVTVESVPQIVSTCCGSNVEVWDERKQDIVAEVTAAAPQPAQPEQKPVGWIDAKGLEELGNPELNWMPIWNRQSDSRPVAVYTSPQAQPLTGLIVSKHFDPLTGAGIPDPTTFGGTK